MSTTPEQAVQDHCVRNIGHKELVKRQHLHLTSQLLCHLHNTSINGVRLAKQDIEGVYDIATSGRSGWAQWLDTFESRQDLM